MYLFCKKYYTIRKSNQKVGRIQLGGTNALLLLSFPHDSDSLQSAYGILIYTHLYFLTTEVNRNLQSVQQIYKAYFTVFLPSGPI